MFKCPKCGYEDSPVWKSSHWRRYSCYANVEDLLLINPELIKELKESPSRWIHKDGYYYQINKKGTVVNHMLEMGLSEFKTHGFTEKPKNRHRNELI